jgi:hypothetical protein
MQHCPIHHPEQSLQQIFLNFIDTFTVWHLRLLKLFHDPLGWAKDNKHNFPAMNMGSLARVLESAFPELHGKGTLYQQIWRDLYQRGLVDTGSLDTTMSKQGVMSRHTSELGKQFLQFIEEPVKT